MPSRVVLNHTQIEYGKKVADIIKSHLNDPTFILDTQNIYRIFDKIYKIKGINYFQEMLAILILKTKVVFIRHGESVINKWINSSWKNFLLGGYPNDPTLYDSPLTSIGHKQSSILKFQLERGIVDDFLFYSDNNENKKFHKIYISPLKRTIQTYEGIAHSRKLPINNADNVIFTHLIKENSNTIAGQVGTPLSQLKLQYSSYNFDMIQNEQWWRNYNKMERSLERIQGQVENELLENNEKETKNQLIMRLLLYSTYIHFNRGEQYNDKMNILMISHSIIYEAIINFPYFKRASNASPLRIEQINFLKMLPFISRPNL